MPRLLKKSDRLEAQAGQIKYLTDKGYQLEEYKSLKILTATVDARQGIAFSLKIYTGTAANESLFKYYRTDEQRAEVIKNIKANTDRRETYKAEQKAKGKQLTGAAQAAAAIREELKTKFKGVKFSVTSDNFSMGNSVHISWTDGPTEDEVSAITSKYQYGHFNGMEDIYEYSNSREDIPQAKFVSEHRKQSEETRAAIDAAALEIWPGEDWEQKRYREQESRAIFNRTSLPIGAKVLGIERGEQENRYIDRLIIEAPEGQAEAAPVEVPAGQIQIIDYSDKAIAIIGDTRPIAEKLGKKGLGLKFNKYLTCGPAWIAPKSRLEEIQKALSKPAAVQAPDPETIEEEQPTPEEMKIWNGEKFEEVAEELRAEDNPPAPLQEDTAKTYDSLEEIEEAANSGKVISLMNLHELVNKKNKPVADRMQEAANKLQELAKTATPQAAAALENTASKLQTAATDHREKMQTIRAEIAEEVQKIKEIGTSEDGFFRVSGPTPASIEARRIESDNRKTGKSNTALPAPQMFISF